MAKIPPYLKKGDTIGINLPRWLYAAEKCADLYCCFTAIGATR